MGRIIAIVIQTMRQAAQTALDSILHLTGNVLAVPFQVFGFGGGRSSPAQGPVFVAPPSPTEILSHQQTSQRSATIRDLDREGVRTVYQFARASDTERATYDLSPIRRTDVQALLLKMTQDQLTTLSLADSGAVRRFVLTGNAGVSGVPMVPTAKAIELEEQEVNAQLAANLRALKERMAKPSGASRPYTKPRM